MRMRFSILALLTMLFVVMALLMLPHRFEIAMIWRILFICGATIVWGLFGYFIIWKPKK